MNLIWLNKTNGADQACTRYHKLIMDEFEGDLYGAVMGSAYGGELIAMTETWGDRGYVYGFDVFEDLHPKHLAEDVHGFDATCMDNWYELEEYGIPKMAIAYQQSVLDELKLDRVKLIKGEVHPDSCKDIPKLHYAFLDMDIPFSMDQGYKGVRDKIVKGGYLLFHDTQNIPEVGKWYKKEVLEKDGEMWEEHEKLDGNLLVVLKRK